jgi:RNA polymerase sigma-70 factor, ECF subfamily
MGEAERVGRERGLRAAVLAGDERAWQTWYDESFVALDQYVIWRCGGLRDLADDVLQETWLTAVRRVGQFDPARACFVRWLCGIAANVARNHVRRRRIRAMPSLNGDMAARSDHQGQRVAHALAELPESYERVLRQKYLDRLSVAEIAADGNDSEKAIESLLTRARAAFRLAYGPED